jgi:hypothetical protein
MPVRSAAVLLVMAALLSGCGSDRGYFSERGYFPDRYQAPAPAAEAARPVRLAPAPGEPFAPVPAETQRPRRIVAPAGGSVGRATWRPPVLQPKTPIVGSPAWEEEKVQTERRERDLNRTLQGICSGC